MKTSLNALRKWTCLIMKQRVPLFVYTSYSQTKLFVVNQSIKFHTGKLNFQQTHQTSERAKKPSPKDAFINPYIKSLRKFFFKVHPDFFHEDVKLQKLNQESFAKLNELLEWAAAYQSQRFSAPPSKIIKFQFACKTEGKQHKMIFATFQLPSDFQLGQRTVGDAVAAVDKVVLSLLKQAGITPQDFERETEPRKSVKEKIKKAKKVNSEVIREQLRLALQNNLHGDLEKLKKGFWAEDLPTVEQLIEHKMLFISEKLTPYQVARALDYLSIHMPEMQFHKWRDIPLMISNEGYSIASSGIYMIPYNFTVEEFNKFLNSMYDRLKEERDETRKRAEHIEKIIKEIEDELRLIKLNLRLPVSHAMNALQTLRRNYAFLSSPQHSVNGLVIEISDKFEITKDGKIVIDSECTDEELVEFIKWIGTDKLVKMRHYNAIMHEMNKNIENLTEEVQKRLGCKAVDVQTSTESAAQKLEFLTRLRECTTYLGRYDWSLYTFRLSDENRITSDKVNGVIEIPASFQEQDLFIHCNKLSKETTKTPRKHVIRDVEIDEEQLDINDEEEEQFSPESLLKETKKILSGEADEDYDPETFTKMNWRSDKELKYMRKHSPHFRAALRRHKIDLDKVIKGVDYLDEYDEESQHEQDEKENDDIDDPEWKKNLKAYYYQLLVDEWEKQNIPKTHLDLSPVKTS